MNLRTAIAVDLLREIRAGRLTMKTGSYRLQDGATCLLTGLVLSYAKLTDVELRELPEGSEGRGYLVAVYPSAQLMAMETAFECFEFSEIPKARRFGMAFDDPTERAVAILENVVANGGEFDFSVVPGRRSDAVTSPCFGRVRAWLRIVA